jgi:hypothetical protein
MNCSRTDHDFTAAIGTRKGMAMKHTTTAALAKLGAM